MPKYWQLAMAQLWVIVATEKTNKNTYLSKQIYQLFLSGDAHPGATVDVYVFLMAQME